jgi:TPR repeat protein
VLDSHLTRLLLRFALVLAALTCAIQFTVVSTAVAQSRNPSHAHSTKQEEAFRAAVKPAIAAVAKGDYATALRLLRTEARKGNPDAEAVLGTMYSDGRGVAVDNAEAIRWYKRAAEKGNAFGQSLLASAYRSQQDYHESLRWFRLLADKGDTSAQCEVASMYLLGQGVEKNVEEAAKWYTLAANSGVARAQSMLGTMFFSGEGLKQDYAAALKWFQTAAAGGDVDALSQLGTMYYYGTGVEVDRAQAGRLWTQVVENDPNNPVAQLGLGFLALGSGDTAAAVSHLSVVERVDPARALSLKQAVDAAESDPVKVIAAAKTISVQQNGGSPEVAVAVEREIMAWGRFVVVSDRARADLAVDLTPTSTFGLAATVTSRNGIRVWSGVGEYSGTPPLFNPPRGTVYTAALHSLLTQMKRGLAR